MFQGLLEHPEDFLRYAVDDVRVLLEVHDRFVKFVQDTETEVFKMAKKDVWTAETIPMTTGALVAKTFEDWLYDRPDEDCREAFRFCIRKLGILNADDRNYGKDFGVYHEGRRMFTKLEDFKVKAATPVASLTKEKKRKSEDGGRRGEVLKDFNNMAMLYTGLEQCGVRWFADRSLTDSSGYNALVQGGRCNNENPYELSVDYGLDIDLSGCYGEALRRLRYPVGLPTVWNYKPNEHAPTLGDWLKRHEKELVPGCWMATVSGPLPFQQDLIGSKLVKREDIRKAVWTPEQEDEDIPASTALLREEIVNGVITHDVLEVLKKVGTNQELAAMKKLKIVTAVANRKSDEAPSLEDWCDAVLADQGEYKGKSDDRTRSWYGVPIDEYVGELTVQRQQCKARAKDKSLSEDERTEAKGLDSILKLFVNTLYGSITCRYFNISNTVTANNITAGARVGVWMLAKALGLRQCVTDGGIYSPLAVPVYAEGRKPGLALLSRLWEWDDRLKYRRKFVPLANLNWVDKWDQVKDIDIDRLATEKVLEFWEPYGLPFNFKVEHKKENTFRRAAYFGKADYALLRPGEDTVYKLRGKRQRKELKPHPSYELLNHILEDNDQFPPDLEYERGGLLKVGKWKIVQESAGYASWHQLRPGDDVPVSTHTARYNNTHMPLKNAAEFRKRQNRKLADKGKPVLWFERFAAKGIDGVQERMASDDLRG
jgi:hypothetical protein